MVTTLPNLTGFSKEILSAEAVTTGQLQCFIDAIAAAISIQCINLPPIKFPRVLVSFGKMSSLMVVSVSFGCFAVIRSIFLK
jgi:hypothetical protein